MIFSSYPFLLLFLPLTVLGFWLCRRMLGHGGAMVWLLVASIAYYGYGNPRHLLLLAALVFITHGLGRAIEPRRQTRAGWWLTAAGIGVNLAVLGYFKYMHFFAQSANAALGTSLDTQSLVLPLAISFFTFQKVAYLVDVYQGVVRARSLLSFATFVMFFPQLIAGPIVHAREMAPQLEDSRRLRLLPGNFAIGVTIFAVGLAKKVLIADNVSPMAIEVFGPVDAGRLPGFFEAWSGALAYTVQIYFDFSGYSDMAIGLARMFGVRLPVNFNSPYKATSIVDFWRRWHITLSRFLRDYLYIPLGGNRKGPIRRYVNLFLTMLLGGLWHGAGWTFVAWGALHGLYLSINHAANAVLPGLDRTPRWLRAPRVLLGWAVTFLAVVVAWVFFRAESFAGAWRMLEGMAGLNGWGEPMSGSVREKVGLFLLIAFLMPNTQQWLRRARPILEYRLLEAEPRRWPLGLPDGLTWRPNLVSCLVVAGLLIWSVMHMYKTGEFIYYRF